jgi:hypothetical protein
VVGRLGDGGVLRAWLAGAVPALAAARDRIDAVNVFPVADGDTGTNVLLTVSGAREAVSALGTAAAAHDVRAALARGALLSARGSSGIILSRYLGGVAAAGEDEPLPAVLLRAAQAARSAVPDPADGTVLTVAAHVARTAADAAAAGADDAAALAAGLAAGRADLAAISAGHPVLRSARVVDAGACALLVLLDALAAALAGAAGGPDLGWLDAHAAPEGAGPEGVGADGAGAPSAGSQHPAPEDAAADRAGPEGAGSDRAGADHAGPEATAWGTGGTAATDEALEVVVVLHADEAPALAARLRGVLGRHGDAVAVAADAGAVTAHVHAADPAAALEEVARAAPGARWTATVALLAGGSGVTRTSGVQEAVVLARAGAVVVVVPEDVPEDQARAALDRAAGATGHGPGGASVEAARPGGDPGGLEPLGHAPTHATGGVRTTPVPERAPEVR